MAFKIPKREDIRDFVAGAARQVNPFDNNQTFKQKIPTQSKSVVQQLGQIGGQTARATVGNTARFINTAGFQIPQVGSAIRMQLAARTGNAEAFSNAMRDARTDTNRFGSTGGILNTGSFYNAQEAARGDLKTGVRRIGGGTLGVASEIVPFARGATLIRNGAPLRSNIMRGAAEGAGYGAAGGAAAELVQGDGFNVGNVAKSAAAGAALGGVAPVVGTAVRSARDNTIPLNESGSVKVPGGKPKVAKKVAEGEVIDGRPKNFNPDEYIAEQTARQEAARQSGLGAKVSRAKATAKAKLVDSLSPIEDPLKRAIKQGYQVDASRHITYALDRSIQSKKIAGQYMVDNGLEGIIKTVPDTNAFDQYLIARHVQNLDARGIKTGRDVAKDAALVRAKSSEYEAAAKALNKYNQGLLDRAVQYGLIKKATADYLKKEYPDYVPINRIFTDEELGMVKGNGAGPASISTQTVVQRLKGSSREIESPLSSIIRKTEGLIEQGERNNAARILSTYKDIPGNPFGLRELRSSEIVGTKPTISFLDKGKLRRFETTPEVAAAAKSLNREQMGLLARAVAAPTRLLRLGATSANAGFALANLARDVVSAFINSKQTIAHPAVFLQALKASLYHGGKEYKELLREGAAGTSFDIARYDPVATVGRLRANKNVGTRIAFTVRHPSELVRAVENTIGRTEEFTRAFQYYGNKRAYLKKGAREGDARLMAANDARNNTVNFARAGEYGQMLNVVLPYFNAGIQGSRLLIRNLRDRPVQTSTKIAITTLFPMAAITAWNLNDPERKAAYDDIRENAHTELENNFVIIPPNPQKDADGRWNVTKIPLSQEVASLADGVRRGVESWQGDAKFDFGRMAAELTGAATSLKTGSVRELANQFTPQAIKPGVEMLANQNLFFGNQIVPDAQKNLAPENQVSGGTSGTAKVIGGATGLSPLVVDNTIRTATAGAGQNLINLSDQALAKTGIIDGDDVKGKGFRESIMNRFDSAQGSTSGGLYFKTIQNEAKKQKVAGKDYTLLNALKSKEIDGDGKPIPQNEQDALGNAAIRANNPRVVEVEAAAAKTLAKKTGQPLDPLYNLTPEQRQTYYRIQASPYKGDDYNRLTDKAKDWLPALQQKRSAFFDSLNSGNSTGVTPTARVQYPTFDDATQGKLDVYFNTTDPNERIEFLKSNPDVNKAFEKINQYTNARRVAQGYDPFGAFPKAAPEVEAATTAYFGMDKDQRKAYIKSNPDMYARIQQSMADSAAWQLANNAGEAKYEGEQLNQKALKATYSLGQYSIFKDPETGVFSINPTLAYLANYEARYGNRGGGKGGTRGLAGGETGGRIATGGGGGRIARPKVSVAKGGRTPRGRRPRVARRTASRGKATVRLRKSLV